jgi:hypothetical protein
VVDACLGVSEVEVGVDDEVDGEVDGGVDDVDDVVLPGAVPSERSSFQTSGS